MVYKIFDIYIVVIIFLYEKIIGITSHLITKTAFEVNDLHLDGLLFKKIINYLRQSITKRFAVRYKWLIAHRGG